MISFIDHFVGFSGGGSNTNTFSQFQVSPPFSSSPQSTTTMPMPTTVPSDRSATDSPFTFLSPPSSTNTNESTFTIVSPPTTTTNKDDYTMVNIAPMPNIIPDDDTNNINPLANANVTRLLTLYNEAKFSNKNAELFSIYQELERRCTGVNCHQLIKDYPAIYETKLNECTHKTVSDLKQNYANIQQQIRMRINNDATHINDIPKEFILESAALLATLKQKDI
jgi:hypothetical protein